MSAKLVSYSQPAEPYQADFEDIKDLVAFCARVSNPTNQMNSESSDKLIGFLLKHKHFSPFEMASVCVEIKTTRDIARQILRHRSFAFQEFSQRYADPTKMKFVIRDCRFQDTKNRQNSIEFDIDNEEHAEIAVEWVERQEGLIQFALEQYQWAISKGIAKEQARCVLPEGNTPSVMYMNGTIRSWIHYLEVRSGEETQKEHREIALNIATAIGTIFSTDLF